MRQGNFPLKEYLSHINYQTITSERAKKLLLQGSHKKYSTEELEWEFSLENGTNLHISDKFLTLFYSTTSIDPLLLLMLESIAVLQKNKSIGSLLNLQMREVDSFLRDQNHLMAFTPESKAIVEKAFSLAKNSLISAFIIKKLGRNRSDLVWDDLSLVEKNKQIKALFLEMIGVFFGEKFPELVLAEGKTLYVRTHDSLVKNDLLEEILPQIFSASEFKVVAVQ